MRLIPFLMMFISLHAAPELFILSSNESVASLNKQAIWLETFLKVPKKIVINRFFLPRKASNKMVFISSLMYGYSFNRMRSYSNSVFVAQSVFESSSIPAEWVDTFNTYFDFVTVPDEYLVEVYQNAGVNIPIFMLPQGSLLEDWVLLKRPQKKAGAPFVFLASGSLFHPRKNHTLLIEAFRKVFGDRDDVQLLIQARGPYGGRCAEVAQEIIEKYELKDAANIVFHYGDMKDSEYKKLVLSCDCFVNVSSGEGFSITPRESLAVGIPTIVTDNTAQTTICKSGFVRVVPANIQTEFISPMFGHVGNQFDPTVDDIAEALLDVYTNYAHYESLAKQAKPWVEQYTAKELLPKWHSLLYPKKIILGECNKVTNDYFMTNSEELYLRMCSLFGQSKE